ncbi:inner-membrane translocator (plasmid) [Dinoroseobacter shibae DFL 12 = DSM 16493]|uniref:Inner-membrane translocator n=1 Tax=Dinoroseobacter shibae (strain DSM 16493 / NCIMB 14021 / DFL 12) TaxID=398580 RepID=A8LUI0_DINSH|nr:ABC transporter permease [Dinoroseobacter shibae]ABV95897.1 inner-membrane translocator [Dinoroseobacter shibae DFL 12 = DSM 16493]URF49212.1 ABC transporter permease [Dinoroseobacter shibae]URF53520.1 ABC transporter permease [Dinoroseobacter shibae]
MKARTRKQVRRDQLIGVAVFLVVWEITAQIIDRSLVLPPVTAILAALWDLILSGELIVALSQSIFLLIVGLFVATVIGFVLGALIARSRTAYWMLNPYLSALFVTPTIALVPLVLVWFGFGFPGRVIVVVLAAVVPILFSVASGLRDSPGDLIDVARSFGVKGEIALLFKVRIRAALPVLLAGLRLAAGRGVVGMAVAETYLRLGGIGGLIKSYGAMFQTDYVFASILPLSLLGIAMVSAIGWVERRLHWT